MQFKAQKNVHSLVINSIRLILILIFLVSLKNGSPLMSFVSLLALLITFVPLILQKYFNVEIPAIFEVITLLFIYGILFIGEVRSFYSIWWWDVLLNLLASMTLGIIGLNIVYVLHKHNRINARAEFMTILAFCLALSMVTIWEVFEFCLDTLLGSGLQKSLSDTMEDIIVSTVGLMFTSAIGYIYIKRDKFKFLSNFLTSIVEKNISFFGNSEKKKPLQRVAGLIKEGENDKVEFKSSFRVNLHTKEYDKKIEHSVLKTIASFLNTSGGNLIVGVDDEKQILGLEVDGFKNDDKLKLHLTNLIKDYIGNEFLPFISFEVIEIKEKKVLLINCKESKKRVFLKNGQEEEFYVRNGPASVRLEGSSLVDYINHKFNERR